MKKNEKISDLLKEMSLEEKVELLSGGGIYHTAENTRLGIPSALFLDASCGVNIRQYLETLYNKKILCDEREEENNGTEGIQTMARFGNIAEKLGESEKLDETDQKLLKACRAWIRKQIGSDGYPSCFPSSTLLAACWNRKTVYENAAAAGREASAYGVDVLLGTPSINIQRDPRAGRSFEYFSEDPYLTGELGAEVCRGVSDQGILTNAKHFAANSQETERMVIDESISERALREIYLPAFHTCVKTGKLDSVMSAYNWINGKPCAQNHRLLKDILRKEWGFDGFVMSDWRAAYSFKEAVKAGNDLVMPGPREKQEILDAIAEGFMTEADVDLALEHFLGRLKEMPVVQGRRHSRIDFEASKQAAYESAIQGITLLKNENGILPLKKGTKIALFGKGVHELIESGTGSGHVFTDKKGDLKAELERAGGLTVCDTLEEDTEVILMVISKNGQEGGDSMDILPEEEDLAMIETLTRKAAVRDLPCILLLNIAAPLELTDVIGKFAACMDLYLPGQEGARAAADLLFGEKNPSGKLPHTFPKRLTDVPAYGNFPGYNRRVCYGEGIYVGYRWYDTRRIEPLFPFGHGLSYTSFAYGEIELNREAIDRNGEHSLEIRLEITNTGDRSGYECVQLYLHDAVSTLDRPEQELKGFEKLFLQPGESGIVTFRISARDCAAYDEIQQGWICEPGLFEIRIGSSSRDIRRRKSFRVLGENPYAYTGETSMAVLKLDKKAVRIILREMGDRITEREFMNIAYFGQRHSFETVWRLSLAPLMGEKEDETYRAVLKKFQEMKQAYASMM